MSALLITSFFCDSSGRNCLHPSIVLIEWYPLQPSVISAHIEADPTSDNPLWEKLCNMCDYTQVHQRTMVPFEVCTFALVSQGGAVGANVPGFHLVDNNTLPILFYFSLSGLFYAFKGQGCYLKPPNGLLRPLKGLLRPTQPSKILETCPMWMVQLGSGTLWSCPRAAQGPGS